MSRDSALVLMASYQAATSYLKFSKKSADDTLLLDPALSLFGEYFSTYAECHIVDERLSVAKLSSYIKRFDFASITLWSYALSELSMRLAYIGRRDKVPTDFMLPSAFIDELHASRELNLRVALRSPRSLSRMLLQKASGYPLKLKTSGNYLFSCIDTSFARSVTPYREISARTADAEYQFAQFAEFVAKKHGSVIANLLARSKLCILLDEDLDFFYESSGVPPAEGARIITEALSKLKERNFEVFLKPTYTGAPCLTNLFSFSGIIPGEIPLEVLDLQLAPGTVVTGFSSSYLSTRARNLRPVGIAELVNEL